MSEDLVECLVVLLEKLENCEQVQVIETIGKILAHGGIDLSNPEFLRC